MTKALYEKWGHGLRGMTMYSCPVPCGVFQPARTSPELRPNMQFGIRHNRQSAGDHSDHVTRHTNNEAWVREEYILGFWDYSGIVSIKSTKRINCVQNIFCLKNGVNNQHCRNEDICFLGNESHWLGNIVTS